MPTVAEQLRAAREAQHLTIHHVADITKIRTDHLRALEEGDFDVFTAPVYIKGFTRCYATLLKLDVSEVMRQLDAELSQTQKFSEPPNLTPHRRTPLDFVMLQLSKVNWRTGLSSAARRRASQGSRLGRVWRGGMRLWASCTDWMRAKRSARCQTK